VTLIDKKRTTQQAADQALIDGLTKNATTIGNLLVGGKTYTVAQAIALVQTALTASKTVVINHTALEASLEAETAVRTQNKPFYDGLNQTLQAMFAGQVDTLGTFGLKARKVPVVAPAVRVAAAKKAAATRAARGTKGKKARLAITAAPATAPATEPAAAAPATAPTPAPKS
jgi:hypothetical protein